MNLIDGQLKDGVFTGGDLRIEGLSMEHSGEVTLGCRAEDISLGETGNLSAGVYSMELLGDSGMVTVKVNDSLLAVKTDKEYHAAIAEQISIKIDPAICHLFDKGSGEKLGDTRI